MGIPDGWAAALAFAFGCDWRRALETSGDGWMSDLASNVDSS
jgi:hypothetical protein